MREKLRGTIKEALSSVLPITAVVFLLSVTVVPVPVGTLVLFIFGALLLIVGMGLFTMGVDMSLSQIGEDIGIKMTTGRKALIVVGVSFAMGVIITVAEPDLLVLANLVQDVNNWTLILTVAGGVGIFLTLAIFRTLLRISLSKMLIGCYILVFTLSFFTPDNFIGVAFDSGGVTTGPITVPFMLAMGLGLASIRGDRDSLDDSFGMVALCSVGPILATMILGICYPSVSPNYEPSAIHEVATSQDMAWEFLNEIPTHFMEVVGAVWPILVVVVLFQLLTRRYHKSQLIRVLIGFIYTFIGLVLFLTGVSVGFIPVGQTIGKELAGSELKWLLIPLGAVIGYVVVAAEPAIHVLKKQVEEVSGGGIPSRAVQRYLSIGTSAALAISMLRVLTGISLYWFLIPGYVLALTLTFFVPKIFTGIAFDSGGVATGPMTSTFLLPFAIGACVNPERVMYDAFGLVAMVAMAPLIVLQLMGIIYKKKMLEAGSIDLPDSSADEIIEFEEAASHES